MILLNSKFDLLSCMFKSFLHELFVHCCLFWTLFLCTINLHGFLLAVLFILRQALIYDTYLVRLNPSLSTCTLEKQK